MSRFMEHKWKYKKRRWTMQNKLFFINKTRSNRGQVVGQ